MLPVDVKQMKKIMPMRMVALTLIHGHAGGGDSEEKTILCMAHMMMLQMMTRMVAIVIVLRSTHGQPVPKKAPHILVVQRCEA